MDTPVMSNAEFWKREDAYTNQTEQVWGASLSSMDPLDILIAAEEERQNSFDTIDSITA
jgi:hypothetical protein